MWNRPCFLKHPRPLKSDTSLRFGRSPSLRNPWSCSKERLQRRPDEAVGAPLLGLFLFRAGASKAKRAVGGFQTDDSSNLLVAGPAPDLPDCRGGERSIATHRRETSSSCAFRHRLRQIQLQKTRGRTGSISR